MTEYRKFWRWPDNRDDVPGWEKVAILLVMFLVGFSVFELITK